MIRDQRVFVGLVDGVFRALELSTGRLIWSRNLGAVIFTTAAEANGVVYAATAAADPAEKDLFALDSQNGSVRWARAIGSDASSPTLANGVLYIGTYFGGNALKAYNAATGAELATYPIRKQTLSEPMVSHGTVYLRAGGGPHGQVFVFTA